MGSLYNEEGLVMPKQQRAVSCLPRQHVFIFFDERLTEWVALEPGPKNSLFRTVRRGWWFYREDHYLSEKEAVELARWVTSLLYQSHQRRPTIQMATQVETVLPSSLVRKVHGIVQPVYISVQAERNPQYQSHLLSVRELPFVDCLTLPERVA